MADRTGKISKKMTFAKILSKYPWAAEIMIAKGMHCFGCPAAGQETLEQGAMMHGIDADKLVDELNKKLKKK